MRLVFMGTPDFSVPALDALVLAGHEVVAVYTQPPRPAGRGKKERKSAVHIRAEALNLPVLTPKSLRDAEVQQAFASHDADAAIVVAYGLILPQEVLSAPRMGCLNIHASLLPRWRGAAPIHRAVMAGDARTGVCIMEMEKGLDTGPVLLRGETEIGAGETTGDLHDRLSRMGADLIVRTLSRIEELAPEPQPGEGVTYADKIEKSEARVDWSKPAQDVDRLIRGLSPYPGAWCEVNGERIKLLRSSVGAGIGAAGSHLGQFEIACGEGSVVITEAQRQGKRAMTSEEVLRGLDLPDRLG